MQKNEIQNQVKDFVASQKAFVASLPLPSTLAILAELRETKGQFRNVRLVSVVPTLKAFAGVTVTKETDMTVCAGVEFGNRKDIREAIEAGERGEVQPLPWGKWSVFPFVIKHNGADYVRLYLPSQAQKEAGFGKCEVRFFRDGAPITRAEAITLCGSKAEARDNESGCMSVKAENLTLA